MKIERDQYLLKNGNKFKIIYSQNDIPEPIKKKKLTSQIENITTWGRIKTEIMK